MQNMGIELTGASAPFSYLVFKQKGYYKIVIVFCANSKVNVKVFNVPDKRGN